MSEPGKPSPVETIKEQSRFLRGTMPEELVDDHSGFGKESEVLMKFHGFYQQDDRDARSLSRKDGTEGKSYIFMVRTKIPGGKMTSRQLLAELDLADQIGNTTLRCTTRQGLQLHGVIKRNLKETIHTINNIQLSTLGACGDVNRNVMCCPAPYHRPAYRETQALADQIAAHLAPRTPAYHNLWLTDVATGERELAYGPDTEVEPIYGTHYMPRKFKIAIGFPEDNCTDVYTNDLGLLAIVRDGHVTGYNVLAGGGLGVTPSAKKTFPALAKRIAYVTPDQALDVVTAIVKVQRDHGNREDRKVARLKYLIANWGVEKFKEQVESYYGRALLPPTDDDVHGFNDHMGWDQQGDGRWFYGLNIENGRIKDDDRSQLKTALREICHRFAPGIRLTSHQSLLFTDIADQDRTAIESILKSHHVTLSEEVSEARRWSMACVAWPTCGLSITEAERALPGIIDQLELELARMGLAGERFTVRMTGCPNGCARPYNSDIGLVGKTKGKYTILVGGRLLGNRLNFVYKDLVPEETVVSTLIPLLANFKQNRIEGETLGDFCHRQGNSSLLAWSESFERQSTPSPGS
ncbi:MAG: NADPH-dependent assimilatory sulfite reductase hemoprotein subunit [Planctomycetes bacterium]|nr:NADPH-dependent assimilatory sulfite reductase hemoprotein subunit [Planctomycetota bacterium]